jgi:hypothetical protein
MTLDVTTCLITQSLIDSPPELPTHFFMNDTCIFPELKDKDLTPSNKYLAWAYSEASGLARQLYPEPRAYYNRKMQKTNAAVAHSALANKLSRAGYYVMRDQVPFQPEKLFG